MSIWCSYLGLPSPSTGDCNSAGRRQSIRCPEWDLGQSSGQDRRRGNTPHIVLWTAAQAAVLPDASRRSDQPARHTAALTVVDGVLCRVDDLDVLHRAST